MSSFLKNTSMHVFNIIGGIILLLFGRKLFWLFVGIAGFLFGMEITPMYFENLSQWIQLFIAIGLGCLGALLAMFAQGVAFAFGGFFAGMYLALRLAQSFAPFDSNTLPFLVIGAGIVGALIAALIMDRAIILLSCLIGAGAIVGELHLGYSMSILVFVILTGAGFLFQEKQLLT